MLRLLVYGLAILHLGPGVAFALLAFGCDGANPYLGAVCTKNALPSFALLTIGSWLILGSGLAAAHLVRLARRSVPQHGTVRVWALLAVTAVGTLVGASGAWLTGGQYWYLAIPASLATGWLFLANPLACQPQAGGRSGAAAGHDGSL